MKLLAGIALFCLCALTGEGRARRLQRREKTLMQLYELIRAIGDRQQSAFVSFWDGAMLCPPSPEREALLRLSRGEEDRLPLLTAEERGSLARYARSDSRSVTALRAEREALLTQLQQDRDRTREELKTKGQVYRSVGYLSGMAALLLVL